MRGLVVSQEGNNQISWRNLLGQLSVLIYLDSSYREVSPGFHVVKPFFSKKIYSVHLKIF